METTNHIKIYISDIVLIEDDADDQFLFVEALGEVTHDCSLMVISNIKQFREFITSDKCPGIIFLDSSVQCSFGKECFDEIKSHEHLDKARIVMYTTGSIPEVINGMYNKGIDLFVTKPSSFNEIVNVLKEILTLNWKQYKPNFKKYRQLLPSEYIKFPNYTH